MGVPARTASDVKHPVTGADSEHLDQTVHLVGRSVGEGVMQVGRPEVFGQRLEPVVPEATAGSAGAAHPLASAHVAPVAKSTANSTRRSKAPPIVALTSSVT